MGTLELATVSLAGSAVGLALGAPMIWPRRERPLTIRFLGGWLIGLAAIVAVISARVIGLVPPSAAVSHAVNLLGLCAYPLLYLYLRTDSPRRVTRPWTLWLPVMIYGALAVARGVATGDSTVPFAWMLPILLVFTALCMAAAVARARSGAHDDEFVPPMWIVAFLVVLNLAQVTRMFLAGVPLARPLVPLVITIGFLALVGRLAARAFDSRRPARLAPAAPRYEKSGFGADAAPALLARLDRALSEQRLFADATLTLGRLAAAVDASPHQVSEVLNRFASTTFHELVTRHRVDDVKAQLQDADADRYTIEGIGSAAGFGSRSALYAAFRRREGISPAQFRAQARSHDVPRKSLRNK